MGCACVCVCVHASVHAYMVVQSLSCVRLFCDPVDYSLPGSSVHGISQARTLEWVAISFSMGSSQSRDWTWVSCIDGWILYHCTTRESKVKVTQLCLILGNPMDCSPLGFSVHWILQTRILEWVATSFSRDLPDPGIEPRFFALQVDSLLSEPPGNPMCIYIFLFVCFFWPCCAACGILVPWPGIEPRP